MSADINPRWIQNSLQICESLAFARRQLILASHTAPLGALRPQSYAVTVRKMIAYRTVCGSAESNHAAFLTVIPRSPTTVNRTVLLHPGSPQHNNGRCVRDRIRRRARAPRNFVTSANDPLLPSARPNGVMTSRIDPRQATNESIRRTEP
jgi:hypothetical protein